MQEQTKLVGLGRVTRSAVGSEMVLPCLDVVLGLTAHAVEPLVEVLGAAAFQAGDDEPGIGSLKLPASTRAMMRSTRLQLWAASWNWPKRRTLPHPGRRLEARGGALLQRCDMTARALRWGPDRKPNPPGSSGTSRTLPGTHNGCRRAAKSRPLANGCAGRRPGGAQSRGSPPARSLAGPQQRGDKTALCVEHNDRLKALIVVVGVEQAQLLAAMHAVEGVINIQNNTLRHRSERAAILLDERPPKAQQRSSVGKVFQPRDRRLRAPAPRP